MINPLDCFTKNSLDIEIQANQLLKAIEEMIPDAKLTNFMRAILKPCLYVLLTHRTATFLDLQEFLMQEDGHWVQKGKNSDILAYANFFTHERNDSMYLRTKQSVYTKIQSLINAQAFYHMTI